MIEFFCILCVSGILGRNFKAVAYALIPLCLWPWGILIYHAYLLCDRLMYHYGGTHLHWQHLRYLKEKTALQGSITPRMLVVASGWLITLVCVDVMLLQSIPMLFLVVPATVLLVKWIKRPRSPGEYKPVHHPFEGERTFSCPVDDNPHIVFIMLESFGTSQMHLAKHFNALKEKGVYFEQFYSNSTRTTTSMISSLYGLEPHPTKLYDPDLIDADITGVPHLLKKRGYETAAMHNGDFQFEDNAKLLYNQGFDHLFGYQQIVHAYPDAKQQGWGIDDEYLFGFAAQWLQKQTGPRMLKLMTLSMHHPWHTPKTYDGPDFGNAPSDAHRDYWKTLHYTDQVLRDFFAQMEATGLDKKCVFFIYGDHGQALGEHGQHLIGRNDVFDESIRVPLLIYAPGRLQPRKISTPASLIDIPPTVADMFSLQGNPFEGASLQRPIQERPVFFSTPFKNGQYGARVGDQKIVNPHPDLEAHRSYLIKKRYTKKTEVTDYDLPLQEKKFDGDSITNHDLRAFLEEHASLTALIVANIPAITTEAFDLEKPHLCLRGLHLSSLRLQDSSLQILQRTFPNLNQIHLNAHQFSINSLLTYLKGLSHLERLHLHNCYQLSDDHIEKLIRQNKSLKYLVINKANLVTDRSCSALAKANLAAVSIDGALITEKGREALLQAGLFSVEFKNCILL